MSHQLKYTTIVPASTPLGESTFAAARAELESRYGVSPVEVFLDGIQVEGKIQAGDLTIDLSALHLRIITFGADAPSITPASTASASTPIHASLADLLSDQPEGSDAGPLEGTTTTTS